MGKFQFRKPWFKYLISTFVFIFFITSCDVLISPTPTQLPTKILEKEVIKDPLEGLGLENYSVPDNLPSTEIIFRVQVPSNTPLDQPIYLSIRDEVTGLALNSENFPMLREESGDGEKSIYYTTSLEIPLGSVVKYRYERQTHTAPVSEHLSNGTPVRYRLLHVEGPGIIDDVVSGWTDLPYAWISGRIKGKIIDRDTNLPVPGLLVTAGGAQTFTSSDGSFLIEGLPAGIHNLVVLSLDGTYQTFQQGARIAEESTTPAEILVNKSTMVNVAFVVQLPADTPPIVPVRIAGNLFQLGNSYATLEGGISSLASNMPVLTSLPDGRYLAILSMPVGFDVRYKYSLGDGFWNAEHDLNGRFTLRQIVVPEKDTVVIDQVETWQSDNLGIITFDITVPAFTPLEDIISIQFNPVFGWTVPLPMWNLGQGRWAYILFSPLELPTDLSYRFCRNGQCGRTDDARTPGDTNQGLKISISNEPQIVKDTISAWSMYPQSPPEIIIDESKISIMPQSFISGIEFDSNYHPSWRSLLPGAMGKIGSLNQDWLVLTPSWTYTRQSPPVLETIPGENPIYRENSEMIQLSQNNNLETILFPIPQFQLPVDDWWQTAARDFSWWLVWFENYRNFLINNADLASENHVSSLIIGGDWLKPALPSAVLMDGTPSGVPADSEERWRSIIAEIRTRFSGTIYWAMDFNQIDEPPPFLDAVDGIYLLWSIPLTTQPYTTINELETEVNLLMDTKVLPFQQIYSKPIFIGITYPSAQGATSSCIPTITGDCASGAGLTTTNPGIFDVSLNLQEQVDAYTAILSAVSTRPWINGIVSRGYYPPAALIDPGLSVHGKQLENLLSKWFAESP